MLNNRNFAAAALSLAVLLTGCASMKNKKALTKDAAPAAVTTPPAGEVQEASLRSKTYESDPEIKPVFFALDSHDFSDATLAVLKANAAKLKEKPGSALLIEGHADDRGTIAYNLALGQERARAVEEYYVSLGIPLSRMSTISYGELKPVC
ncbi:MAG: OmpA family protein, partial [Elusimicrobia bacterium]|nr:OmpA family protein [Elusimicrobiota bacterium]